MTVYFKQKRKLLTKQFTAWLSSLPVALLICIAFDSIGALFFCSFVWFTGMVVHFYQFRHDSGRWALAITEDGIMNQYGSFGWGNVRNLAIERQQWLVFQADNEKGQELSFRYNLEELTVEADDLYHLIYAYSEISKT